MIKNTKNKRSRGKYPCPPKLESLIEQYNYAPPETLPDLMKEVAVQTKLVREHTGDEYWVAPKDKVFAVLLKKFPLELQNHLRAEVNSRYKFPTDDYHPVSELAEAYAAYRESQSLMQEFINLRPGIGEGFDEAMDFLSPKLNVSISFMHRGDGRRHLPGLLGLIGMFDDSRLRICAVEKCGKVFWAKRINSETCSTKCYEKWRQPRFRQHYQNSD